MSFQELRVGARIHIARGVELFGAEEVNEFLKQGWRVVAIESGGVVFNEVSNNDAGTELDFIGCDLIIVMEPPERA